MGDGPNGIEVFPNHFQPSTSYLETPQSTSNLSIAQTTDCGLIEDQELPNSTGASMCLEGATWFLVRVASMLNLFKLRRVTCGTDTNEKQKVILSAPEVESLRSVVDLEENEAQLKARLEHIDETLRSACFSGYLHMRTRWTALLGETLPLDDTEVDDWVPLFVVLQGQCIFFYSKSTDISPQDSTLVSDVIKVGRMPRHPHEGETRYLFYIVTRQGLRYECSSTSKLQVDAWLTALQDECKLGFESTTHDDLSDT